jgi:hypothetical protein
VALPLTTAYWANAYQDQVPPAIYHGDAQTFRIATQRTTDANSYGFLATSQQLCTDYDLVVDYIATAQFRPTPNPWETLWLWSNYHGPASTGAGNYFLLKPNGFEVGIVFGETGQDYALTGKAPLTPIGTVVSQRVRKVGQQVWVWKNGVLVMTGIYGILYNVPGNICLYCEDSDNLISSVQLEIIK